MKEAITEPAYKALHTLSERKAAFEEFLVEEDRRLVAERDQSLARCRKEWTRAMDKVGGGVGFEEGVKSWWSWERGARVLSDKYPEVWALPRNDDERKILFDEYIAKLRTDEEVRLPSPLVRRNSPSLTFSPTPDPQTRNARPQHGQSDGHPPVARARPRRPGALVRRPRARHAHARVAPRPGAAAHRADRPPHRV